MRIIISKLFIASIFVTSLLISQSSAAEQSANTKTQPIMNKDIVSINTLKPFRLSLTTDFAICPSIQSVGPSLELGLKMKNNYLGLNFLMGFNSHNFNYSDNTVGGGLIYRYLFNFSNILIISPSFSACFLSKTYSGDYYFLCGPGFRIQLGYKYVFFNTGADLLFGTGVQFILKPGISVYF